MLRWDDGHSASAIARAFVERFGRRISRNAVIGKLHRSGATSRGATPKRTKGNRKSLGFGFDGPPNKKSVKHVADVKSALRRYRPGRGVYLEPPHSGYDQTVKGCAWDALDEGDCRCRWPISSGPEHKHGHRFCGEGALPSLSWCAEHAKRAFGITSKPATVEAKKDDLELV